MPNVAANAAARVSPSVERVSSKTSQTVCLCVTELAETRATVTRVSAAWTQGSGRAG